MQKYEKYQSYLSENFQFLEVKLSIHLNRRVFVMDNKMSIFEDYLMARTSLGPWKFVVDMGTSSSH